MQVLIDGGNNGFYIMPKGQETNPDLSKYVHETQAENIEVTEEEYQIYCEMGSSFQLCKVKIIHKSAPKNYKKVEKKYRKKM